MFSKVTKVIVAFVLGLVMGTCLTVGLYSHFCTKAMENATWRHQSVTLYQQIRLLNYLNKNDSESAKSMLITDMDREILVLSAAKQDGTLDASAIKALAAAIDFQMHNPREAVSK